jgi:hypothetical protein
MLEKYRATVQGNRIEWDDEIPKTLKKGRPQKVDVILISDQPKKKPNGKKMAEALAKIAAKGGVSSIKDPDKWLREVRNDRPLPGRK